MDKEKELFTQLTFIIQNQMKNVKPPEGLGLDEVEKYANQEVRKAIEKAIRVLGQLMLVTMVKDKQHPFEIEFVYSASQKLNKEKR